MSIREPRTRRPARGPFRRRGPDFHEGPRARGSAAPPTPPPRDSRSEIIGFSGLLVLAGIWLIIAPWVLGYSARDPRWNDVVFGIIVGVLALTRVSGAYRAEVLSWINLLIGAWLVVACFTIDYSARASWNDVILGVIVFLLAAGSAEASSRLLSRRRRTLNP
ncbi:MAG TPA: SPW repeat protein [Solirubrobacteraceae bacterium]|nr:SPW repeat protein [Solirubrobacteraceae bacterium]